MNEAVELLAARAPKLRQAIRDAKKAGHACVIVDGTLIPAGRLAADRPFYSGKHKKHGMNLQVNASPAGDILWISGALPGSVHDKKAEWIWGVLDELEAAGLVKLADQGYQGSTWGKVPCRGKASPDPRRGPTVPTRNSAPPEKGQTCSSKGNPHQAALLPVARRETRQGHPRFAGPPGITRMKKVQSTLWVSR